jgi:hypothetical protein
MNTNQRRLSSSRDELPRFAFIRVRLGNGINDFLLKARALGNARPTMGTASIRPLEPRFFRAAYLCKVLEIADRCGAG